MDGFHVPPYDKPLFVLTWDSARKYIKLSLPVDFTVLALARFPQVFDALNRCFRGLSFNDLVPLACYWVLY